MGKSPIERASLSLIPIAFALFVLACSGCKHEKEKVSEEWMQMRAAKIADLVNQKELDAAYALAMESMAQVENANGEDSLEYITMWAVTAVIHHRKGEHDKELQDRRTVLRLTKKYMKPDNIALFLADLHLGNYYRDHGSPHEAVAYYGRCVDWAARYKPKQTLAIAELKKQIRELEAKKS